MVQKGLWQRVKDAGEVIGSAFLTIGVLLLIAQFILVLFFSLQTETGLLGASLGLISVGLGFVAIGMSAKSDRRHTDLLQRLDRNVGQLPLLLDIDKLTPSQQKVAKEMIGEQSKIASQKRLDEDTKRVGFVRGEIYQLENGTWGIHWGGKYPL